jgi:molecular chaperone DnaK (HSP70)
MLKCKACNAPLSAEGQGIIKCYYCGVLTSQSPLLLYNLSIETYGDVSSIIVPKQTFLPYVISEVFSTAEDNQSSVQIHLLQGDNETASHNRSLGKLRFEVFPLKPRTIPQIEVFFAISANGELKISAKNLETKKIEEFAPLFLSVI